MDELEPQEWLIPPVVPSELPLDLLLCDEDLEEIGEVDGDH